MMKKRKNYYRILLKKKVKKGEIVTVKFQWLTNLKITEENAFELACTGRKRWQIENEGFNIQKNGTFDIGHLYSKNATAIKVHYLMIQIAHMIRQMLEKGQIQLKDDDDSDDERLDFCVASVKKGDLKEEK